MKNIYWLTALCLLAAVVSVHGADNMSAFPPAGAGMARHVLHLSKQHDDSACKVQLIVGKTVLIDEKNKYFFSGKIEEETIEGWGFPRYTVSKLGQMAGTLMAVDPKAPKVSRFITLGGRTILGAM